MKKIFYFACLIAFILFCNQDSLSAQSKMGYVDFQYLISQLQATQDIQAELERLSREWTQQIDAMKDTIENLEKELETISIALSKSSRDILIRNIEERKQKLTAFREQKFSPVSGELYRKQQELLQPLIDKIKKSIDNVRLKQKYDVIFDISAGNPVSIDRKYDLTTVVIEEFTTQGLTLKGQSSQQKTGKDDTRNEDQGKEKQQGGSGDEGLLKEKK